MNLFPLAPASGLLDAQAWPGALPAHLVLPKLPQLLSARLSEPLKLKARLLEQTQRYLAALGQIQVARPWSSKPAAHLAMSVPWTPLLPAQVAAR